MPSEPTHLETADELIEHLGIETESTQQTTPTPKQQKIVKTSRAVDDPRQAYIQYAYTLGGLDMVATREAENSMRDPQRLSTIVGANGYRDQGMCQLNRKYHLPFIQSADFANPYKQLDYCAEVYRNAVAKGRITTTFYGYNKRHTTKTRFSFIDV